MEQVAHVEACRLCANFYVTGAEVEFVHLFEPIAGLEEQLQFLHTQINAWQLYIRVNDGLPQRICANCFNQFCNMQGFHQQCVLGQQKLLQQFVGVGLSVSAASSVDVNSKSIAVLSQHENPNHVANLTNQNALLNGIKIDIPVTSAELMATLDCLQPPTTTSADVIASLDSMQLPASVAETLSLLTQDYTSIQNNSLLDTSGGNAITTHAIMDTKTEETNVLQFTAAPFIQNIYNGQQAPITAIPSKNTDPVTLVTTRNTKPVTLVPNVTTINTNGIVDKNDKTDIDLEDMLQGSVIQKNSKSNAVQKTVVQHEVFEEKNQADEVFEEDLQQSVSSIEDFEEDMDYISCSDPSEPSGDLDDLEPDADEGVPTRISGNPLACQYCYCPNSGSIAHLIFDNSDALSQHFFDVHDPNLPYTCPYCSQKYNSAKQRNYHVPLQHPAAAKTEQCKYCKMTLRTPKELHEVSCQFVDDWQCKTCDKWLYGTSLSRFHAHQRNHTKPTQFKCSECDRVFVRRANLQAHERMHRKRSSYGIKCKQCQEVFANEYEMRRHNYQSHNGDLPVRCEYCMKGFLSMAFLSRHTQHLHPERLSGGNYNAASCTNCGCMFSSLHKLRIHIQRPRDENGRCMETVRELPTVQDRSKQTRRPRLHACQHCNKRFSTQATLEKHMRTHDSPPFNCNECVKSFQNSTELQRHIADVHSRPRYLKCDQCNKRFFYMRELQAHVRKHAEEVQQSHMRTMHPAEVAAKEANNNNINSIQNTEDAQAVNSLFTPTIINNNVQMNNNNNIMLPFENGTADVNEKVRVELVQQQTPNISQVVLQEQTPNTFKSLIPTHVDDMDQSFLMSSLLDAEHEIIVT
ncbi:uncharacterized protein [Eurosta solidaginis]|uniref:uncharacterized protein isoform X1 n=2 Tax=Eurosta solidaginis TaxID=178769 RepID=UPI003530D30A